MNISKFIYKIQLIWLILLLPLAAISAGEPAKPYAIGNIPKKLLLNANAVVRVDELNYTIENTHSSRVKIKHAITLLNENAADYRRAAIGYDKSVTISNIKATVYDSNGEIVFSAKPEIYDVNGNFDELASDQRYWVISFPIRKYPYTVEYEYEKTIKESFFYEDWSFQAKPDVSIQQSGIQYIVPKEMGFRVKEMNLKNKCDTFSMPDKTIYTWQEDNIPAYKPAEQLFISFDKKQPTLLTAPNTFTMGGLDGSMESWQQFGQWKYDLNKNRDVISPDMQTKMKNLISGVTDPKEQIRRIYNYMQKNTRYVSIQLGIGGYQTLEASFVEKKGFGDCKALSNYMKALLKSVGITAYPVNVLAGNTEDIDTNFPSQQFNHIILCVPLPKDTVWLECTDQTQPFNFLGSFTDDRHALLITENGGKLVKTPEYGADANFTNTAFTISIDMWGNAKANGNIMSSGLLMESPLTQLKEGKKEQEKWVNSIMRSPNITINKLNYSEKRKAYPCIEINSDMDISGFATKTTKRMVLNPYLFNPMDYVPQNFNEDFSIHATMVFQDSITIKMPFGYKINNLPAAKQLESKFGIYQVKYMLMGDNILYFRKLQLNKGKYTKEDIDPFTRFANTIAKSDRQMLVLLKE